MSTSSTTLCFYSKFFKGAEQNHKNIRQDRLAWDKPEAFGIKLCILLSGDTSTISWTLPLKEIKFCYANFWLYVLVDINRWKSIGKRKREKSRFTEESLALWKKSQILHKLHTIVKNHKTTMTRYHKTGKIFHRIYQNDNFWSICLLYKNRLILIKLHFFYST